MSVGALRDGQPPRSSRPRLFPLPSLVALAALMLGACVETRTVAVTFGDNGEGLDGFLCREGTGTPMLKRLEDPSGVPRPASLVIDFVGLQGLPGCRSGQLIRHCTTHDCRPLAPHRACVPLQLPAVGSKTRGELRAAVKASIEQVKARLSEDAPAEAVMVRVVGTSQSCQELMSTSGSALPAFDPAQLVGCAYSCPVLLDVHAGELYLGFDTLTEACEQGVRICAAGDLRWRSPT